MQSNLSLPSQLPDGFQYTDEQGWTSEQAEALRRAGKGNEIQNNQGKTVGQILKGNLFTFFNLLNVLLALALLLVGSYRNMTFMFIIVINVLIGTVQEYKAQKTIRNLQLLNAPSVRVIRSGQEITCKPEETVQGDLVVLHAGDQVIGDAIVVSGSGRALESLLTGESDAIHKEKGSWLYSGSAVTEGRMTAQLVYVGAESYVGRLTREAKKTTRPGSRLRKDLDTLIGLDSVVLLPLGILLFLKQTLISKVPVPAAVPATVAAMIGMIPEGLVLLTSIAMAVGVRKLSLKKTLVQELAGIETLARADVLCLDKTGTITTGKMAVDAIEGIDATTEEARRAFSRFLGAFDEASGTLDAMREAVAPDMEAPVSLLPFSSKRKKSAAAFEDGTVLIMGAPEFVLTDRYPPALREKVNALADQGKRVVVLVEAHGVIRGEELPPIERILGLCALYDQIRPGAAETLRYFAQQDVQVKVISGDNPHTVSRIAKQAGLKGWDNWTDAREWKTDDDLEKAAEEYTLFGRVTPEQKQALVKALKKHGHNVAMTGDGVNDIPALKAADCSIAMASGSDAAKNAAQLTLLTSDFTAMPDIVLEGRQVINNITRTASLFLMKTLFSFGLSILMLFFPGTYPFQPIQMTLVSALMVGFPGFVLSLEKSTGRIKGHFIVTVLKRAMPGGVAVTVCAAAAMLLSAFGWEAALCSTLATILAGVIGYTVLALTCQPFNKLRAALLAVVAAGFVGAVALLPKVFFLTPLDWRAWIALAVLSALGIGIVLFVRKLSRMPLPKKLQDFVVSIWKKHEQKRNETL
ncbi:MAG: HAD-IC family P-type ATPase [Clostridia bacterium]|nr:HAD-IC family P-type ATPase [Clostridia bacterium]